jgi:hypothetical protein
MGPFLDPSGLTGAAVTHALEDYEVSLDLTDPFDSEASQ